VTGSGAAIGHDALMKSHPKPATPHTRGANAGVRIDLDPGDFERASRGLVARHPTGRIEGPFGAAWDLARYAFIGEQEQAPDTVNPSLWRQARLNAIHGLFELAPGLWQARGYDLSNITFVAGEEGWVVIDPLTSAACARACLELANEQLGARPVTAVIYTHSHADHFGGVLGVTTAEDVAAGRCRVIAPEGFLFEAVSENLLAGPAMARRAAYQFGPLLPPGARGQVDAGLGKSIPFEPPGLLAPTEDITHTGQELVVDGVRIVFQLTPETEAPAEMNFFFPDHGWLCMAENCTHTMHNLVPIRGAQVRNALRWSKYIGEAIELFGARTQLFFASHHWPRWGADDVRSYLTLQRDLYRFMHDQALRFANHGLTAPEIAETLALPPEFLAHGHTRGYYGDLVHNAKAVYQRYLSWYDGNPARLHAHPPVEAGKRYVAFMGGAEALLEQARASFEAGDYRWVVEVVNHLVFAEPGNTAARELQADALEQLGYQAESATFRNAYLTGAQELRQGPPPARPITRSGLVAALTIEQAFDAIAIRLRAEAVGGISVAINFTFSDSDERWLLGLSNRTLYSVKGRHEPRAAATVTLTRARLLAIIGGEVTIADAIRAGDVKIAGDGAALGAIFGNLDTFQSGFAIVEP
jgi:alkyl sulfatase BDS1-like metallo-beta-lactamase superfamily hydrolase